MKKGLLFVLLLVSLVGFGQCPSEFTEQSQIDDFASQFPNCTTLEYLYIHGNNIINLHGLSQITSVDELIIANTAIQNFEGLESIETVSVSLLIQGNNSLQNFIGFSSLTSLYFVRIFFNNSLTSFQGLDNLEVIESSCDIKGNELLNSVNGLQGLISAGDFSIRDSRITNLEGLDNFSNTGYLGLSNNSQLINLQGLENLTTIESLGISENSSLINLNGVENLDQITSNVNLYFNENLVSIDALNDVGPADYSIALNFNLSECAIYSVCQSIFQNPDYSVYIDENGTGCNSVPEVEAQCDLAITEADFFEDLSIFPNPVSSTLNIKTSGNISFEKAKVYSTLGTLILETSEKQINLETLSAGIYFVEVVTNKGNVTKKIIKK
ncbi:MAG: T9SS type A sorting domain-containing protein [Aequorivita sp.]|nr:T9SS type A sorting domain-containing protein [Aequorivita sp.]